jgi:organic hydroperoxide reductase OsmC/OhrA
MNDSKESLHCSEHTAAIRWQRDGADFSYDSYPRDHEWLTGSGQLIPASAAPAYLGSGKAVDPEEAFVAAVASCHMLSFLAICARRRLLVNHYTDDARGVLEKNAEGRLAVTRVELSPRIEFADGAPDAERLDWLHERAHAECFIANSVRTEIVVLRE